MYNKKKQKVKFKLRPEFIVIMVSIVLMITLAIVLRLPDQKTKFANTFAEYGVTLSSEHVFEEIDFEELYTLIESNELTFVVFGSYDDTDTLSQLATIDACANYWDVETVYYVDATDYLIDEDADDYVEDEALTKEIQELEAKLATYYVEGSQDASKIDIAKITLDYTPGVWAFNNGKLAFNVTSYLNEDETGLVNQWAAILERAFCINLPESTN